jgi:hypothetical protein
MEDGKMVLIAYHLLESSLSAYIEWPINEPMMTANKKKYKNAHLVRLLADAINPQARKPLHNPWSLFLFSWRVSLVEYN